MPRALRTDIMCCSERSQEPDGESAAHTATVPLMQPSQHGKDGAASVHSSACLEGMQSGCI